MKRHFMAAIMAVLFALAAVGTASASGLGSPLPGQSNSSDQDQLQVIPIAPQANVQNVNVGGGNAGNSETRTVNGGGHGDIEQGNANNANTGQASQQQNTVVGGSGGTPQNHARPSTASSKPTCGCPRKPSSPKSTRSTTDQSNHSDQSQVQIVPIAPQLNVQNVNVGNHGDVEQGNANNANTGQANQQQNTQVSGSGGREHSYGRENGYGEKGRTSSSHDRSGGSVSARQSNRSEQEQIQFIPIAPQANVQNVNVLTFGDVEQGNANNANTGQANQQENTASTGRSGHSGDWNGDCERECPSSRPHKSSGGSASARQSNWSDQDQIQIVPIAPQANVQNVNVLTFGDVEQGNANNANTGQANQQQNTASARGGGGHGGDWKSQSSGGSVRAHQSNWSEQEQLQFIPIAPQLNVQNVNVATFGDVEQGNANNANTGQANQQQNTASAGGGGGGPWAGSWSPKSSGGPVSARQSNWSEQEQLQFIPIAPQANFQNVNLLTSGDVEQGNANNANTGQASQQQNTVVGSQRTSAPRKVHSPGRGCKDSCGRPKCDPCEPKRPTNRCEPKKRPAAHGRPATVSQRNSSEQEQIQFVPIAPQANFQNVNAGSGGSREAAVIGGGDGEIEQGNANNANTGQASQQQNTVVPADRFERRPAPAPPPVLI